MDKRGQVVQRLRLQLLHRERRELQRGKSVEISFTDCIIYSATGAAGTRGIKLRSPGGTTFYSEGWSFATSTCRQLRDQHDVTDVFAYQVVGGYHGVAGALSATRPAMRSSSRPRATQSH
jgi:hypothetical protein